jgi:hypothetical protein
MSENDEFKSFDHERARRWVAAWVSTVDHPQLTWAWDVVVAVIDVYATMNLSPDNTMTLNRKELWYDWFNAWQEGDAHWGVHGVMQEFAHACPEEHVEHQLLTLNEAYDIGMGRKLAPKGGKKRQKPEEKPAAPTLRVVVDNTNKPAKTTTRKP